MRIQVFKALHTTDSSVDPVLESPTPHASQVPEALNPDESFSFLERCYSTCLREHPQCQPPTTVLPRRVLDVSSSPYRLIETATGSQDRYAALSYRWGGWARFTTKKALTARMAAIEPESMPIVFQEAAFIAQRLKIPYLWIDNICIVQDDKEDWLNEATKMAEIYESASIVIAASSVPDPGTSFLKARSQPAEPSRVLDFPDQKRRFRARRQLNCGVHAQTPAHKDLLDERAWSLQEKELACRWVSYSTSELQWRCKALQTCECSTEPILPQSFLPIQSQPSEDMHYAWQLVVEEYTSRKLTDVKDKLPALMGLANKFQQLIGATHVSGLWRENIVYDLAWKRDPRVALCEPTCVAPTFSWASVLGDVTYQPLRHTYAGDRKVHTHLIAAQQSGEIEGSRLIVDTGTLILRGPTLDAMLQTTNCEDPHAYELNVAGQKLSSETYFDPTAEIPGFELSMDSIVNDNIAIEHEPSEATNDAPSREERISTAKVFEQMPVKLLSLFSLVRPSNSTAYQVFVIMIQVPNASQYQRIGLGVGKRWIHESEKNAVDFHEPFSWAANPLDPTGASETFSIEDINLG